MLKFLLLLVYLYVVHAQLTRLGIADVNQSTLALLGEICKVL